MSSRFSLDRTRMLGLLAQVERSVMGADQRLIIDAYVEVVQPRQAMGSWDDLRRDCLYRAAAGYENPLIPYDILSKVITRLPSALRNAVSKRVSIKTGEHEQVRVTPDGQWQIVWTLDPHADPDYRHASVDWYFPSDEGDARSIPDAIVDCLASCVMLYHARLLLPAVAVLSIVFESTLWDALAQVNFSRCSQRITYVPVNWHVALESGRLVITVEGADKSVNDLEASLGADRTFIVETQRMQGNKQKVGLHLIVDRQFVDVLASEAIKQDKVVTDKGLSVALEKGRREDVGCLHLVDQELDKTLITLRNNLIHLPSGGQLDEAIDIPGGRPLRSVEDLRTRAEFVQNLLTLAIDMANAVYANRVSMSLEGGDAGA